MAVLREKVFDNGPIIDSEGEGGVSFTSYQSWYKDVMAAALNIRCTPLPFLVFQNNKRC